MIDTLDLIILGVACLGMAIFSGISGGGGGFIMTPLMIFLGMTPAQAVATGKFSGLAVTVGSLHGLRSIKPSSKKRLIFIMSLAVIIGLISPFFIKSLDSELYKTILGVLLLAMIPVLIYKKVGHTTVDTSGFQQTVGYILLALAMFLQAVFSGGLGTLVNIVLMGMIGLPALEANVTKRYSQLLMNILILLGVIFTGLVVWKVAVVGVVAAFIGGMIGSRIAIKKGNKFVMTVTLVIMAISGLWLVFS